MKLNLIRVLLIVAVLFTMSSCSSDSSESPNSSIASHRAMSYTYNSAEIETMALINAYRVSIGLNELKEIVRKLQKVCNLRDLFFRIGVNKRIGAVSNCQSSNTRTSEPSAIPGAVIDGTNVYHRITVAPIGPVHNPPYRPSG
mgnify:CR=1 FL=1